jgi:D-alanyl-D-alanine carboxypeptidase
LTSLPPFASSVLHLLALMPDLPWLDQRSGCVANSKYAGIVVDAKTGKTLYAHDADELRYPASLTKMMTLYMVFEALEQRKIKLNTRIKFSANAAKEPPTKLGVGAGKSITVEQAIYALVTKSANDASTAVAEHLGGSAKPSSPP